MSVLEGLLGAARSIEGNRGVRGTLLSAMGRFSAGLELDSVLGDTRRIVTAAAVGKELPRFRPRVYER